MMNSVLFGNGYWGHIVKEKISDLTNLTMVIDSQSDIESFRGIDIAFVCSSTDSHYDIVSRCLSDGIKFIFCEKPFTGDYVKACELFDMADKFGADIFVDNVFLFRNEIASWSDITGTRFRFMWNKNGCNRREGIYNSLLYHDLYLLSKLSGTSEWRLVYSAGNGRDWYAEMENGDRKCSFRYDVGSRSSGKWIIIDGRVINLSLPTNDPLGECIVNFLDGKMDLEDNRRVTLSTLQMMNYIKEKTKSA